MVRPYLGPFECWVPPASAHTARGGAGLPLPPLEPASSGLDDAAYHHHLPPRGHYAAIDTFLAVADGATDQILDFNAAEGDRVLVEAGVAFTTAQVGADTVITLAGGGHVVLSGVQFASLHVSWIVG